MRRWSQTWISDPPASTSWIPTGPVPPYLTLYHAESWTQDFLPMRKELNQLSYNLKSQKKNHDTK